MSLSHPVVVARCTCHSAVIKEAGRLANMLDYIWDKRVTFDLFHFSFFSVLMEPHQGTRARTCSVDVCSCDRVGARHALFVTPRVCQRQCPWLSPSPVSPSIDSTTIPTDFCHQWCVALCLVSAHPLHSV